MTQYAIITLFALLFAVIFQRQFIQDNYNNLTIRGQRVQFILLIAGNWVLLFLFNRALG